MDTILIFAGGDSPSVTQRGDDPPRTPRTTQRGDDPPQTPRIALRGELPQPDLVVAADSGYDLAVATGYAVDVLIGDMDSITTEVIPGHVIVERHPRDKDATDLELALARVIEEAPERIVVVGGGGGRVDHELAVAALLTSDRWAGVDEIDWVTDRGWSHVVRRHRVLHGDVGDLVTLIPMGGHAHGVDTSGLRWNLKQASLFHGTTHGVSNEFAAPVANVHVAEGCLLAVIPAQGA